ncbi:MAG: PBP1A family penicillin-binding protein [Oscillospiraceae bacterium]|jgi:penicillin-binding protein 1A|nr:PBP1A family penicillin-binding protein [Oscillospiraceae bacterium]
MKKRTKRALRYGGHSVGHVVAAVLKVFLTVFLIFITTTAMLGVIGVVYVNHNLQADLDVDLNDITLNQTSFIYYIDKTTKQPVQLESLYGRENRVWANYDEIPNHMVEALIAIEDKRFYRHRGVDWKRTVGAFLEQLKADGSTYGGSTITQQLIKNVTNEKEVTIKRKLTEILRALEFEKHNSKQRILEYYLNTSYFGQSCYGVKTAARTYFDKDLSDITLAEAACIIGITNSPTRYDPLQNPDKNKIRQEVILQEMYVQGRISKAEHDAAVAQKLTFSTKRRAETESNRSYFVDQVFNDVVQDLVERKGISKLLAQQLVLGGGYRIYATIDMDVQAAMDEVFTNEENIPKVKGVEKPQSAMVILDPYTGDVLGLEGGLGVKKGALLLNRATRSSRQPGSAIKPIAVYGPAMQYGIITPYSVIDDVPFSERRDNAWPRNSGGRYLGRVTALNAITNSRNASTVHILHKLTPELAYGFLTEKLGITSLTPEDQDYAPLALGGLTRGVSALELTAAYAAFPNHGIYTRPRTYTVVYDSKGNVVLENEAETTVAFDEKNAWYMNNCLQNVIRAGTGSRARLENGQPAAGKTGTTSDDFDRWFVGYTPYYCGGVWFGFDDPKKIQLENNTNPALAIWKLVMDKLHENLETQEFFTIENTVQASYCLDSGCAPTDLCRLDPRGKRVATGVFYKDDVPKSPCPAHAAVKVDGESGLLATPYCPEENLQEIALLDIERNLPLAGVSVDDEAYRIRYFVEGGDSTVGPVPEGFYPPARPVAPEGKTLPNDFCPLHLTEEQPEDPNTPPDGLPDGIFPPDGPDMPEYPWWYPDIPWDPENPGGNTPDPGAGTPTEPNTPPPTPPGNTPEGGIVIPSV